MEIMGKTKRLVKVEEDQGNGAEVEEADQGLPGDGRALRLAARQVGQIEGPAGRRE